MIKSVQCWAGREVQEISDTESNYSCHGLKIDMHAPHFGMIDQHFFQKVAPDKHNAFKKWRVSRIPI